MRVEIDLLLEDFINDSESGSDEFEWDGCVSAVVGRRKRKRTNKEIVKAAKIPRVLLLDIRKCYAKMLVNVLNSQDFPMLYGFLDTYFAPNAHHTSTKIVKRDCKRKQYSMNIYGTDEIAKFYYSFMNLSPDDVTTLTESTIQHTTGKVVTVLHKDGTQIYEKCDRLNTSDYLDYSLIVDHNQQKVNFGSQENEVAEEILKKRKNQADTIDEKIRRMRDIMASVDTAVSRLVLRKYPVQVCMNGTFTISTDENKKITQVEACVEY